MAEISGPVIQPLPSLRLAPTHSFHLEHWARRGTYPTYLPYYDHHTPLQGYYPQSPYPFTPAYPQTPYAHPTPQGYRPQPSPYPFTPVYPQNFYPFRYQAPQTLASAEASGQPPVFNNGPRAPTWPNTEAQLNSGPRVPTWTNTEAQLNIDPRVPLPPSTESRQPSDIFDIQLHSELWWNLYWTENSLGIIWDVTLNPSVARLASPRFIFVDPNSEAPAIRTQRRYTKIELSTDHPYLAYYMRKWGPISVSETNPTILQLLEAIHEYLKTPLTEEDYRWFSSQPQNVERLNVSRESRVRDGFDAVYGAAIQGPFRRSDTLGGHRRFLGIRVVKLQDEILTLHFNLGPGPVPRYH